jgi:hypothetical protein
MSVSLASEKLMDGEDGHLHLNNATWREVLNIAHDYGWEPAGTEPGQWIDPETGELIEDLSPSPDEWNGSYAANNAQWVTDADAANIADALERALQGDEELNIDLLRKFITFCRAGAFSIW